MVKYIEMSTFNKMREAGVETTMEIPTQEELRSVLRNKNHHVVIMPRMTPTNDVKYYIFRSKVKVEFSELFNTYEEALEVSMREILEDLCKIKTNE